MDKMRESLMLIVTLAVLALFVKVIVASIQSFLNRINKPDITAVAKVTSKKSEIGTGTFSENGISTGKKVFYATFESEGNALTFQLSESEYNSLSEGDFGHLSYRGDRFLGFAKDTLLDKGDKNEN